MTCAKQDLHSGMYFKILNHLFLRLIGLVKFIIMQYKLGVFGGSIPEAMTEISHIFSSLIDIDGTIKIPGLSAEVDPVTDAEKKRYENIDFSLEEKV